MSETIDEQLTELERRLMSEASKVPGGYNYSGICSVQICFPLKSGGELRLMISDDDESDGRLHIDYYDGSLPPGITGPAWKTGSETSQ